MLLMVEFYIQWYLNGMLDCFYQMETNNTTALYNIFLALKISLNILRKFPTNYSVVLAEF